MFRRLGYSDEQIQFGVERALKTWALQANAPRAANIHQVPKYDLGGSSTYEDDTPGGWQLGKWTGSEKYIRPTAEYVRKYESWVSEPAARLTDTLLHLKTESLTPWAKEKGVRVKLSGTFNTLSAGTPSYPEWTEGIPYDGGPLFSRMLLYPALLTPGVDAYGTATFNPHNISVGIEVDVAYRDKYKEENNRNRSGFLPYGRGTYRIPGYSGKPDALPNVDYWSALREHTLPVDGVDGDTPRELFHDSQEPVAYTYMFKPVGLVDLSDKPKTPMIIAAAYNNGESDILFAPQPWRYSDKWFGNEGENLNDQFSARVKSNEAYMKKSGSLVFPAKWNLTAQLGATYAPRKSDYHLSELASIGNSYYYIGSTSSFAGGGGWGKWDATWSLSGIDPTKSIWGQLYQSTGGTFDWNRLWPFMSTTTLKEVYGPYDENADTRKIPEFVEHLPRPQADLNPKLTILPGGTLWPDAAEVWPEGQQPAAPPSSGTTPAATPAGSASPSAT